MSSKRLLIWGSVLVACGLIVWYRSRVYPAPPPPVESHIVFVTGGSGPYWQIAAAGAVAAAESNNVKLTIKMPETEESGAEQSQILSQLDFNDVEGLAISPLDAEGQTRRINRIADEVPVVTFDSDAPLSDRQCYVGTTNFGAGELCADLVREAVPDGGKVAVLQANLTKYNNMERKDGFDESIHAPAAEGEATRAAYSIVGYFVDEGDEERCAQNIRDVLKDYPDVKCLVGMNGHHGPILVDVLRKEGKLGDIKLVVFDAFVETLDGIADGHIHATLAQDPFQYGYESVRLLKKFITAEKSPSLLSHGTLNFAAEPIRRENLDDFRKRLQSQLEMFESQKNDAEPAADGSPAA